MIFPYFPIQSSNSPSFCITFDPSGSILSTGWRQLGARHVDVPGETKSVSERSRSPLVISAGGWKKQRSLAWHANDAYIYIWYVCNNVCIYIYIIYILSCERLQCMYYMAAQFLSAQHIAIVLKTVRYTHDISWYIQFTLCSKNVAKHWTLNDPLQRLHMVWNPHLDMGKSLGHPSTLWNLKTAETAGIKTVSVTAN
jgi:hypothetical protein